MFTLPGSLPAVRTFALALALGTYAFASAQVSVFIQQPEANAGPLEFTWSETWGAGIDTIAPIIGNLVLVDDGTAADSLGCESLVNGAEMAGNIALLYRGTCEFGTKALNAEQAGAIGVVIVNNIAGPPVGMGAGADGAAVTIPVVMISQADGMMVRGLMDQGPVELLIGNIAGMFPFNLGLEKWGMLVPRAAAMPTELTMSAADFSMDLGAFAVNYGSAPQDSVQLRATVSQGGTELYNEVSAMETLPMGDTVWFALPEFSQSSYSGHYEVVYTIESPNEDAFPGNNTFTTSFHAGDVFSYADVDPVTGIPISERNIQPAGSTSGWTSCIFFKHPEASRVAVAGMYVNMSTNVDVPIEGAVITAQVYHWDELVEDPDQIPVDDLVLTDIATGDVFLTEADNGETVYVPFLEEVALEDNENYLFCQISTDPNIFHGHDNSLDYTLVMDSITGMPVSLQRQPADGWFGWADVTSPPSIGVLMIDVNSIGINENDKIEITPFPNPTADRIRIPVTGQSGSAMLEIFDMSGAKVGERNVNVNANSQLDVELNGLANGTYMFNMQFENGRRANFRVVLSR